MEQRQLVFILVVVTLLNFLALVAFEIFFSTENVIAVINGVWTKAAIFGSLAFTALIISIIILAILTVYLTFKKKS